MRGVFHRHEERRHAALVDGVDRRALREEEFDALDVARARALGEITAGPDELKAVCSTSLTRLRLEQHLRREATRTARVFKLVPGATRTGVLDGPQVLPAFASVCAHLEARPPVLLCFLLSAAPWLEGGCGWPMVIARTKTGLTKAGHFHGQVAKREALLCVLHSRRL